jgi:predicted CoA-substrate-specific enzyme activase
LKSTATTIGRPEGKTVAVGVDAGSRAIKIALLDTRTRAVVATGSCDQGINQSALASDLLARLLAEQGLDAGSIAATVATGYGRHAVAAADRAVTEITCHATGVYHLHADVAAVIDIGGQDSKFIHLGTNGLVVDFSMNDRCAAGTGRFLEVVAQRLDVPIASLGEHARRADKPASISSMCVVFAESELIGLLASGTSRENIIAGVCRAIAQRIAAMAGRIPAGKIVFTGGVARVAGMRDALAEALRHPVTVASDPCMTGAIGAAIIAARENGGSE